MILEFVFEIDFSSRFGALPQVSSSADIEHLPTTNLLLVYDTYSPSMER